MKMRSTALTVPWWLLGFRLVCLNRPTEEWEDDVEYVKAWYSWPDSIRTVAHMATADIITRNGKPMPPWCLPNDVERAFDNNSKKHQGPAEGCLLRDGNWNSHKGMSDVLQSGHIP